MAYLRMRASEPCAMSVFESLRAALAYVEEAGEVADADLLSDCKEIRNAVEDLTAQSQVPVKSRGQAERYPVMVLERWETEVMDAEQVDYVRMLAWLKLVKTWATLRQADLRGLPPSCVEVTDRGMSAKLVWTKTSGGNKRQRFLYAYVSSQAWFLRKDWLAVGWSLWEKHRFERDYFHAMPNEKLDGIIRVEALYHDAAVMTRILAGALGGLIDARLRGFWTEHAERNFVPSAAAALEFPEAWVDALGRWAPKRGEVYVRTARLRIESMQEAVALAVKKNRGLVDIFDEESILSRIRDRLLEQKVEKRAVDDQVNRLRAFAPPSFSRAPPAALALPAPPSAASASGNWGGSEDEAADEKVQARGAHALLPLPAPPLRPRGR